MTRKPQTSNFKLPRLSAGTKTVLFGKHQFLLHPIYVWIAWLIIYRQLPNRVELCAIITHDLGYWGLDNIDGPEGERHPARAALWWIRRFGGFGRRVAQEILGHSRFYARASGIPLSRLYNADKLAPTLYPRALYLLLGYASGEIREYIDHSAAGKYKDEVIFHPHPWAWLHEAFAHMSRFAFGQRQRDAAPSQEDQTTSALFDAIKDGRTHFEEFCDAVIEDIAAAYGVDTESVAATARRVPSPQSCTLCDGSGYYPDGIYAGEPCKKCNPEASDYEPPTRGESMLEPLRDSATLREKPDPDGSSDRCPTCVWAFHCGDARLYPVDCDCYQPNSEVES